MGVVALGYRIWIIEISLMIVAWLPLANPIFCISEEIILVVVGHGLAVLTWVVVGIRLWEYRAVPVFFGYGYERQTGWIFVPKVVADLRSAMRDIIHKEGEMSHHLELIHTEENDPVYNMPYTPAIKVRSGATVYVAGVTAAPVYHHHPHIQSDFEHIPLDPGEQTKLAMENLRRVLQAAGGDLTDIVQLFRFICDIDTNQDAINKVMGQYLGDHRATSTTVEVTRLATDDRLVVELAAVAVVPD